jgi:hypothetical protein
MALNPFLTRKGEVVFNDDFGSTFRSNGRTVIPLARVGDATPIGGTVTSLNAGRAVNDDGAFAYVAGVGGAAAVEAVFRTDGIRTTTIARDDIAPPTGGRFTSILGLDLNGPGQVAFLADMTGGSADHGIFRGDGGYLTPVFITRQAAPAGGEFEDFGDPKINSRGQVMAICSLTNSPSPKGVFVGDGLDTVEIALIGHPAPTGGNYALFTSTPKFNDRGEVAFQARLTDGTTGMFRGDGKRTTTLALSGNSAPGTTGVFQSFGDVFELGNDGRVAIVAKLAVGVGGVESSNNTGIWTATSSEDLRLVVRTGEVIGGKVLTAVPFDGSNAGGRPLGMNETSILWRGSFGPSKAIIVSALPGDRDGGNEEDQNDGKR